MNYEHIVEVLSREGVVTSPLESELVQSGLSRTALFNLASKFKLALPEIP
jgi:hypothetical protein